jgi:hydrogenase maturation protease
MIDDSRARILVACMGNIFLGDDGFGCEVARALAGRTLPTEVKVVDYGIRGFDLAFALLEPYEAVILVDAVSRGCPPGTVSILEPAGGGDSLPTQAMIEPHSMDPVRLLALARSLGEIEAEIFIVGCEPLDFGGELEGRMGLSEPAIAAVPEAVRAVRELAAGLLRRKQAASLPSAQPMEVGREI